MDEKTFEEYKKSAMGDLNRKVFKLGVLQNRYWPAIASGDFKFDKKKKLAQAIEHVTKKEVLDLMDTYLLEPSTHQLLVMEYGKQEGNQYTPVGEADHLWTSEEFRSLQQFQPAITKEYDELMMKRD